MYFLLEEVPRVIKSILLESRVVLARGETRGLERPIGTGQIIDNEVMSGRTHQAVGRTSKSRELRYNTDF